MAGIRAGELQQVALQTLDIHRSGLAQPEFSDPIAASVMAVTLQHAPRNPAPRDFDRDRFAESMVEHGIDAYVTKQMEVFGSRAGVYANALEERPLAPVPASSRTKPAALARQSATLGQVPSAR
jgi:hypothetical protein